MSIVAVVWLVKQLLLGTLRDTGNNIPRKSRSVFFFSNRVNFLWIVLQLRNGYLLLY